MRKIVAISFLLIHLFNICGYRLFFTMLDDAANRQMIVSLDNNAYDEADLFQVKFALHSPYIQGSGRYERFDGNIEYNGVQYNYVKRMVQNDTLYLYCIPNHKKTDINRSRNEFASQSATDPSDNKPVHDILKQINFSNEFQPESLDFTFDATQDLHHFFPFEHSSNPNRGFVTKHVQPPDLFI